MLKNEYKDNSII